MAVLKQLRNRPRALVVMTLLTAAVAVACSSSSPPAPAGASDVVAKIGDRNVTLAEVDEEWRRTEAAEQAEASFKLYDGRR